MTNQWKDSTIRDEMALLTIKYLQARIVRQQIAQKQKPLQTTDDRTHFVDASIFN